MEAEGSGCTSCGLLSERRNLSRKAMPRPNTMPRMREATKRYRKSLSTPSMLLPAAIPTLASL